MSQLLSQLKNNLMYQLHAATYNPDAEAYAAEKQAVAADISGSKKADISGADLSGADLSGADLSGVICFTTTVQLSPTNFFANDTFNTYYSKISKEGLNLYQFNSLAKAKSKAQSMYDCTGILTYVANNQAFYLIYTADATLINTAPPTDVSGVSTSVMPWSTGAPTNNLTSMAATAAALNPQFLTAMTCAALENEEERKTFSINRLLKRALGITGGVLGVFLFIALGIFGASLATNLNVYRGWPYRLLYAIYGFVFFFVVIPYVLLWRWAYLKKRPRFYSLIPIIGVPFENRIAATLLSWLTFEPDDEMAFLDGCRL